MRGCLRMSLIGFWRMPAECSTQEAAISSASRPSLATISRSARDRRSRNWRILGAGAAGLLLGGLLVLLAPRMLPGSVDVSLAAIIVNADRWNAGISLMRSGSPKDWSNLVAASNLVRANQEALAVMCGDRRPSDERSELRDQCFGAGAARDSDDRSGAFDQVGIPFSGARLTPTNTSHIDSSACTT